MMSTEEIGALLSDKTKLLSEIYFELQALAIKYNFHINLSDLPPKGGPVEC